MKLDVAIKGYLEYLRRKGRSSSTIALYGYNLKIFQTAVGNIEIERIDFRSVKKYELFLSNKSPRRKNGRDSGLSRKTKVLHLISLRGLIGYLERIYDSFRPRLQIELPKSEERLVEFLTKSELDRLFKAVEGYSGDPFLDARNKAILHMLYSTGMKVSEMLSLGRNAVDMKAGEVSIMGRKEVRKGYLYPKALKLLKQYLAMREDRLDCLFISRKGLKSGRIKYRRLEWQGVWKMVKNVALKVGIDKNISPQTLRHSLAMTFLNKGEDLPMIKHLLGHASISTTEIYSHMARKR